MVGRIGCDFRLSDVSVSREHLRVGVSPHGVVITDDGSKNGTFIGTLRIARAVLTRDTTLVLGSTTLSVRLQPEEDSEDVSERRRFGDALGVSTAMRRVFSILERGAKSDVPILLEGEHGVGKALLARAVHDESARRDRPLVTVDCGAVPPHLLEGVLFGEEGGVNGAFREAEGGTLLLDEIGALPMDLQAKLLRALDTGIIRPLGGVPHPADVRVLAATPTNLDQAVDRGEFRADLFFRLAVLRVVVPPLRDRPEDIVPLARAFLDTPDRPVKKDLPPQFIGLLSSYLFPGNVRELKSIIERYAILELEDPGALFESKPVASPQTIDTQLLDAPFHEARQTLLNHFERAYLTHALETCSGVITKAVERTGISRPTLYRMMNRIGLTRRSNGA